VLHGNWRGLEFFSAAVRDMDAQVEETFLARLAEVFRLHHFGALREKLQKTEP